MAAVYVVWFVHCLLLAFQKKPPGGGNKLSVRAALSITDAISCYCAIHVSQNCPVYLIDWGKKIFNNPQPSPLAVAHLSCCLSESPPFWWDLWDLNFQQCISFLLCFVLTATITIIEWPCKLVNILSASTAVGYKTTPNNQRAAEASFFFFDRKWGKRGCKTKQHEMRRSVVHLLIM